MLDIKQYYEIFEAMEAEDLVLNLHGESPGVASSEAEANFISTLLRIHKDFPRLSIVLEHVSTREGINAVRQCGSSVCTSISQAMNTDSDIG